MRRNIAIVLICLLGVSACTGGEVKDRETVVTPALSNRECGEFTFLYGTVGTHGTKDNINGYFIKTGTSKGIVHLLTIKPDANLLGKAVIVSGIYRTLHINGLPLPDGRPATVTMQNSLQNTRIIQVVEKGIDAAAIEKECKKLTKKEG